MRGGGDHHDAAAEKNSILVQPWTVVVKFIKDASES